MKYQILDRGYLKKIALVLVAIIAIIITIVLAVSRAKYRNTQSIALMSGTITYSVQNVNHIYVKEQESGSYKEQSNIPKGNYELNTSQSYCTKKPSTDHLTGITFNYNASLGTIDIIGIPEIKTECYIYFDQKIGITPEETLAMLESASGSKYTILRDTSFRNISSATDKLLYRLQDNYGSTYVFRGNPDNWVIYAGMTWRIIRINGDGTLRLLYYCGSTYCSASENAVSKIDYNTDYADNTYVGFYYGIAGSSDYNTTHSNKTPSTIATALKTWYNNKLLGESHYIDGSTGFCNDRQLGTPVKDYPGDGTGSQATIYASASRLVDEKGVPRAIFTPKLTCEESDLFTVKNSKKGNKKLDVPVGLITADEAAIGGLLVGNSSNLQQVANKTSYVSAGSESYWTMSPFGFRDKFAYMYYVSSEGYLGSTLVDYNKRNAPLIGYVPVGIRPVINLSFLWYTPKITGNGNIYNPFVIDYRY